MDKVYKNAAAEWLQKIQIRHMRRSDLPALEWNGEYKHFRRVYADAFQRFEKGSSILWVADMPGTGIIGQVFIQLNCDRPELSDGHCRAYLYSFRIKPNYRGLGLGTRILEIVEDDLRKRGFEYITLNVAKDNPEAQKLYLRHGYRIIAHEPGIWWYPDHRGDWHQVNEPAWRMEKRIQKR
jgi:ribosomal protein S18 acetylase RimI-like enzyme